MVTAFGTEGGSEHQERGCDRHTGGVVRDAGRASGDPFGQRTGVRRPSGLGLQIELQCIAPDSPWENGYAESFHSKLVDEFLPQEEFDTLTTARKLTGVVAG